MARRASYYKQSKDDADMQLIVDAGAFCRPSGEINKLDSEYLLKSFSLLNYDVLNLSVRDLTGGGDYIKQISDKNKIKIISANVFYKDTEKLFAEPYTILKLKPNKNKIFKDLKIGILGVCDERAVLFSNTINDKQLESKNPIEAAKKWAPELRKKSDLVILLAHVNSNVLNQLLNQITGIDIIIYGGGWYSPVSGMQSNDVILARTQSMGKDAGKIAIQLNKDKKIISYNTDQIHLDENIKDDPKIDKLVKEHDAERMKYYDRLRNNTKEKISN